MHIFTVNRQSSLCSIAFECKDRGLVRMYNSVALDRRKGLLFSMSVLSVVLSAMLLFASPNAWAAAGRISAQDVHEAKKQVALAAQLCFRGDHDASDEAIQKAVTAYADRLSDERKALAEEFAFLASAWHAFAIDSKAMEVYDNALASHEASIKAHQQLLVDEYSAAGKMLREQLETNDAEKIFKKGLARRLQFFGDKHPETAVGYMDIGDFYVSLSEYASARASYEKALAIRQMNPGEKTLATADTYYALGLTASGQGEIDPSGRFHYAAITLRRELLPPDSLPIGYSAFYLADIARQTGYVLDARELYEEAANIFTKHLGAAHEQTIEAVCERAVVLVQLARGLEQAGELIPARDLYEESSAVLMKYRGIDHHFTRAVNNSLNAVKQKIQTLPKGN